MAIWKDPTPAKPEPARFDPPAPAPINEPTQAAPTPTPIRAVENPARESVIAADLTIEGKIEGAGHVRIAGKFKGDVNVKGDLTVEQGAKLTGSVRAEKVTLSGELEGNIESARRVDLLATSVMNGDIKADDLTIATGARVRGHVECGWADAKSAGPRHDDPAGESAAA